MKAIDVKKVIKEEIQKYRNSRTITEAFTKQHYIAIANLLCNAKSVNDVKEGLIRLFSNDNPQFDEKRFRAACDQKKKSLAELKNTDTTRSNKSVFGLLKFFAFVKKLISSKNAKPQAQALNESEWISYFNPFFLLIVGWFGFWAVACLYAMCYLFMGLIASGAEIVTTRSKATLQQKVEKIMQKFYASKEYSKMKGKSAEAVQQAYEKILNKLENGEITSIYHLKVEVVKQIEKYLDVAERQTLHEKNLANIPELLKNKDQKTLNNIIVTTFGSKDFSVIKNSSYAINAYVRAFVDSGALYVRFIVEPGVPGANSENTTWNKSQFIYQISADGSERFDSSMPPIVYDKADVQKVLDVIRKINPSTTIKSSEIKVYQK